MKQLLLLIAFSLISALAMAQDLQLDNADEKPAFKRWGCIVDFERGSSQVNLYNLSGIYGVNFAGGHLFYGAGLSGSYVHRAEETFDYTGKYWENGQEVHRDVSVIVKPAIDKALVSLLMDFRYQVLVNRQWSPILQCRIADALDSQDLYCSQNIGFCYNFRNGRQFNFTIGYMIYTREHNDKYSYGLLNLNAGFKF